MWWECSECGYHLERPYRPMHCDECGTAGPLFVEAETPGDERLGDAYRDSWLMAGMEWPTSMRAFEMHV